MLDAGGILLDIPKVEDMQCNKDNVKMAKKLPGGQCAFVTKCKDCAPGSNFNFLKMYYCHLDSLGDAGQIISIIPIGGLLTLIFMYNLSSTADEYLSPALEFLTNKLKISESLAGVTLLALGNGAPDIFAAISANSGGDDGA